MTGTAGYFYSGSMYYCSSGRSECFTLNQLQIFLHPDLISRLSGYVPKRNKTNIQLRVVVLHDNLGAVKYALDALGLGVDKYMLWDQWNDVRDLNDEVQVIVLDHADRMNERQWAQLCPVNLLISCVPLIVENRTATLSGRQVGRRVFSEGSKCLDFNNNFDLYMQMIICLNR